MSKGFKIACGVIGAIIGAIGGFAGGFEVPEKADKVRAQIGTLKKKEPETETKEE